MPIPDAQKLVAEVQMLGNVASGGGGAKNFANVYHFRRTTNVNPYNNTSIANEFIAAILPAVCAAISDDYVTTGVSARCVNDAEDLPVTVADVTPGAIAGQRLPDYNATMLLLRTNLRGRWYRGRKFYGPIAEADSDEDVLSAGAITRFGTIITALGAGFTDSDGNPWIPVVLSRNKSTLDANPTNVVAADVTSIVLNKTLGTLRRRKVRTVR